MNRPSRENGTRPVRDAIVMSGWGWEAANVPERIALALSCLGARVLYCENPSSRLRSAAPEIAEILPGIFRLRPQFLGHRLNRLHLGLDRVQARIIGAQVRKAAARLQLKDPFFIYPHGDFFVPLCREFKKRSFPLVHCCFDYPEPGQDRHIELSDCTLTLSKSIFHQLHAKYGAKIVRIPQVRWLDSGEPQKTRYVETTQFSDIPKPRLGYIGLVSNRLNFTVLRELLVSRPQWHFVHFGDSKCLPLPNVHTIEWRDAADLDNLVASLDVGFMPYDCHSNKDFHCMPLKLFDYFNVGIPVVSTPIINLWEYSDAIYFGDTTEELATAIELALGEPADSSRKSRRKEIAKRQSIAALAESLSGVLFSGQSRLSGASEEGKHFESVGLRNE
jgi:hypothetical protein